MKKQQQDIPNLNVQYFEINKQEKIKAENVLGDILAFFGQYQGTAIASYDAFIAQAPLSATVETTMVASDNVNGYWCTPKEAKQKSVILYIHGGAYIMGSAKAFRGMGTKIAELTQVPVFLLEYPLSEQAPFPAAPESAILAYQWLIDEGFEKIIIMGDSAGGGLALTTLQQTTLSTIKPVAGVVFSPWTDLTFSGDSWKDSTIKDLLISRAALETSAKHYINNANPKNPQVSPLFGKMESLPPLLIQVGTNEYLLDDAVNFAYAAAEHRVKVNLEIWEAMYHVFQNDYEKLATSQRALERATDFIRKSL
ncbi:alpha/beta hydrolase fold domain-containing protein [Sphingobacterium sp. MYb382]|uniref:alpha/beta hydrolase fold domain-containing protein n=1 Tax=Sphingobacterium sp. MYb382 TaxID=2745278 RepID=UPI0030AB0BE4